MSRITKDELVLFISDLEKYEDIALLLCTFLGITREELSTLTVNSVLKDDLFLYDRDKTRVFNYNDTSEHQLLRSLLARMNEEEIRNISRNMDERFVRLGELINMKNMTFDYIRASGKEAGTF
ncbi:hypothetical protein [Paenibacillus terrae]|uniref:Uncharacterized protein n=1 Tax=Paenibacillus terrae TaxID=159743 RepID=A0A0D7WUI1_9BACL|nr:hypothetical protein [Paenibacillus terrae]KJD42836.1 hypothetical protein QD47_25965 [Paenibacillus terrae]